MNIPSKPAAASITYSYDPGDITYPVIPAQTNVPGGRAPLQPAGSSLLDAVLLGAQTIRHDPQYGTLRVPAQGVYEAKHGEFTLAPLEYFDRSWQAHVIDGPNITPNGIGVQAERSADSALRAVVGSESWIDLSSRLANFPQPLPGSAI